MNMRFSDLSFVPKISEQSLPKRKKSSSKTTSKITNDSSGIRSINHHSDFKDLLISTKHKNEANNQRSAPIRKREEPSTPYSPDLEYYKHHLRQHEETMLRMKEKAQQQRQGKPLYIRREGKEEEKEQEERERDMLKEVQLSAIREEKSGMMRILQEKQELQSKGRD